MQCRFCQSENLKNFIDLGTCPPSNAYLTKEQLQFEEVCYPLRVHYCQDCFLVQTEDYATRGEMFSEDYAYFSSMSTSWVEHAKRYSEHVIDRFKLEGHSKVVEIASNDGYLLKNFVAAGIPALGVEPTLACANAAINAGVDTIVEFFGVDLADQLRGKGHQADLMIANNVLAHVPDINDFVAGFAALLKDHGVATFEFPHLVQLVKHNQFDTIYHEHFSYLSLLAVSAIFEKHGLQVFDVEQLPTHGGSLRVFAQHEAAGKQPVQESVAEVLDLEMRSALTSASFYDGFQEKSEAVKNAFISFLVTAKKQNKKVAAYGAAAKGNTLLNFAGIKADMIEFVTDKSPIKKGRYMPGSHIPIVDQSELEKQKPDYVIIFPWNISQEIVKQISHCREWGAKFVIAVPELKIF